MNRSTAIAIGGYAGFFLFWFVLFCYWTFPYDRVTRYVAQRIESSGLGYSVEIGDLDPYWVTGVELEDVKLTKLKSGIAAETTDEPQRSFNIREARVRLGILPRLFGTTSINFDAELEEGEIEGEYEEDGAQKSIQATLSDIDLSKMGLLASLTDLPVKGELGGEIDLKLATNPTQSSGKAELKMKKVVVGDGVAKAKIGAMGGLTIDPIEVGNISIELDVKEGVGTVKKLTADGKDLEIEGSGEVRLTEPLSRSRIDLLARIKFTDAYRNKSDRTKAMFALLDNSPVSQVRSAKTPDGSLQFKLVGSVKSARAIPAGADRGGRPARKPRKAAARNPSAPEPDDE